MGHPWADENRPRDVGHLARRDSELEGDKTFWGGIKGIWV